MCRVHTHNRPKTTTTTTTSTTVQIKGSGWIRITGLTFDTFRPSSHQSAAGAAGHLSFGSPFFEMFLSSVSNSIVVVSRARGVSVYTMRLVRSNIGRRSLLQTLEATNLFSYAACPSLSIKRGV